MTLIEKEKRKTAFPSGGGEEDSIRQVPDREMGIKVGAQEVAVVSKEIETGNAEEVGTEISRETKTAEPKETATETSEEVRTKVKKKKIVGTTPAGSAAAEPEARLEISTFKSAMNKYWFNLDTSFDNLKTEYEPGTGTIFFQEADPVVVGTPHSAHSAQA